MAGLTPPSGGFMDRANQAMGMASQSYSMQQRQLQQPGAPDKTAGGGIMAGAGMGVSGAVIGGMMAGGATGGMTGPQGALIGGAAGAIVGLAGYFLS